jgi:hypothetical protein
MGTPTIELLTQAIEAGDKERAKNLANRMRMEFSIMHDIYMDWTTALMSYIYPNHGEDALYQANRKVWEAIEQGDPRQVDFRSQVEMFVTVLRSHLEPIEIEEDDEKVCVRMKPCGSGQKLVETGRYYPPYNFTRIQKPHPMTWGMTDFPVYCTHSPVIEILSIERFGYPVRPYFPAKKMASEGCKIYFYKNVDDIPEEVYTRVGKKKPRKNEGKAPPT